VLARIDVDRNPGGEAMMNQYTKGQKAGLPWFAFLDPDSKIIATSQGPNGNIGCPHSSDEIDAFGVLLRQASPALSVDEVSHILGSLGDSGAKSSSGR
jgi:hypothetical protein